MEDKVLSDYGFSQEEAGCPGGSRDVFETDFVPGGAAAEEKYTLWSELQTISNAELEETEKQECARAPRLSFANMK